GRPREAARGPAPPAQAFDVGEQRRRLDHLAVTHRHALLVDLPRPRGDLAGRELPHLGEARVVELPRLVEAARPVLEAEALLPRGHEALPPDPVADVVPQVGAVGVEVQGAIRALWSWNGAPLRAWSTRIFAGRKRSP